VFVLVDQATKDGSMPDPADAEIRDGRFRALSCGDRRAALQA
jgi:hypothetical protein